MAQHLDSPEAVLAAADAANSRISNRRYMGSPVDDTNVSTEAPERGQQASRSATAADPAYQPYNHRQGKLERNGGSYTVVAGVNKPVDPTISGQTMANARMLPSATNRSGGFAGGAAG
jgi:hypothetical protein